MQISLVEVNKSLHAMYLLKFILRNDFVEGKRITIEGIVLIRQQVSRDRLSVHNLKGHETPSMTNLWLKRPS